MPETITKTKEDGSTEEVEVFTKAELDAQLKEKDEHHAKKIDEFVKGKTAQELADIKRDEEVAAAKKIATDALAKVGEVEQARITGVKNFIAEQYVGQDADLRKSLDESFDLITAGRIAKGLDVISEKAIQETYIAAARMAGIAAVASPTFPMVGGHAPNFQPAAGAVSDQEHERFLKETGYQSPTPAKKAE